MLDAVPPLNNLGLRVCVDAPNLDALAAHRLMNIWITRSLDCVDLRTSVERVEIAGGSKAVVHKRKPVVLAMVSMLVAAAGSVACRQAPRCKIRYVLIRYLYKVRKISIL